MQSLQISEGGRSIHEIEKQRKKLEAEKFDLETALGDAESALEQEENKLLRLSLEVNQVRIFFNTRFSIQIALCIQFQPRFGLT